MIKPRVPSVRRLVSLVAACTFLTPSLAALPAQPTWTLSAKPTLTIGTEGDPQREFQAVTGMARAANGNIAVVNEGSHNIRLFDANGKFLRTYGKQGGAPGEFENIRLIGRAGDSLFVFDQRNRRISMISLTDGYKSLRALPTVGDEGGLRPTARLQSGALLALPIADVRLEHQGGTYRDSIRPGILAAPPSQAIEWLGTFPNVTYFAFNPANTPRAKSIGVYRYGGLSYFVASGDLVWFANSDSPELQLFDHSAKPVRRVHVPLTPRRFNPVTVASARQWAINNAPNDVSKAYMASLYDDKYRPTNEPLFGGLIAGTDGSMWIAAFNADPRSSTRYTVLDKTGRVIAHVNLPAGFLPHEIGATYVLGVARADNGIETLAMYPLKR